jgi:hypothetical protein
MRMYRYTGIQEYVDVLSEGQEGRTTVKIHEGQAKRNKSKGTYAEGKVDRNTAEHTCRSTG